MRPLCRRAGSALATAAAFAPLCCALELVHEGPCECLNWKETYGSGAAACSRPRPGPNDGMLLGMNDSQVVGAELCDTFLSHLDDSSCLNVNGGSGLSHSGQWCYVSQKCQSGVATGGAASVLLKRCSAGEDALLGDKSPEDLFNFAKVKGLSPALFMKVAYPVEKGLLPFHVRAFFGLEPNVRIGAPSAAVLARIEELRDAAAPVVLDSLDSAPPFAVIQGPKTYLVDHETDGSDDRPAARAVMELISPRR
mmetsp:Transcript_65888/g.178091  ORF Transcript_65888/g.178091 Transcript_65888/m.178091 type:complete len:252 (-) Transcript_65888:269-1024(-)